MESLPYSLTSIDTQITDTIPRFLHEVVDPLMISLVNGNGTYLTRGVTNLDIQHIPQGSRK